MFIGYSNGECSAAKVRKNTLNICSGKLQFNRFVDKARVSNCVSGLRNIKKKDPNMLGIVKCIMNVFNDPKQLVRREMLWLKAKLPWHVSVEPL